MCVCVSVRVRVCCVCTRMCVCVCVRVCRDQFFFVVPLRIDMRLCVVRAYCVYALFFLGVHKNRTDALAKPSLNHATALSKPKPLMH